MPLNAMAICFKAVDTDGLRRLQMNPSDTIAVQSAWEDIERSIPANPKEMIHLDRAKLARFLGFLEGRARVQAPQWWAEALLDARAHRRGNVIAGGLNMAEGWQKADAVPGLATFDRENGQLVVRVGTTSVPVPKNLREKLDAGGPGDGVSAFITSSRCYVAVFDDAGYPYRLACVDRASVKTRWVTDVWASWLGAATGVHHQWVEITEQGNRVVVFGVASTGFHAEAFRMEDGVNTFRFSNYYSMWAFSE